MPPVVNESAIHNFVLLIHAS